jgi:hypothetical protein
MKPTYCRHCGVLLASAKKGGQWRGIEWQTMKKKEQEAYLGDKTVWVTGKHTIHVCRHALEVVVKSALSEKGRE